ncbi:16S rRNA (guanine(527)-N(7))-methyltransferase RsmG [Micromonospora sp. NBC_01813]|uniref:16S rRNA (guanine(527)-N(7))-methyltransferase RsmG n=1 Tax=Micromonospora sp. NBC_01813 TaxID=2975988 RepID=UPI002DDAEC78|nr:16S rRNA (guanine(527)-N(7))-methyltransferase RsmG [Micromonospora sp. NBC_01813]WSA07550.1 16S rRNA (guanine(527)-N(7))-methyltransferase RsmG [Micromonospora sp. NBC_01813]
MTQLPVPDDRVAAGPDGNEPSGPAASDADRHSLPPAGTAVADSGPVPPAAGVIFGAQRLPLAVRYAELLATEGVLRGLIGPREVPRIWDRHLLNCAVLGELIPADSAVLDVGSGAGLPGLALALARPDLRIVLVEPLARRVAFLVEAVEALGLADSVEVVRGRAEELHRDHPGGAAPVVTARAVAPLDRLVGWCLPLTVPGGRLLAMKGSSAAAEIDEHRAAVTRLGGSEPVLRQCGGRWVDPPTTVVEISRLGSASGGSRTKAGPGRSRRAAAPRGQRRGRS